MVDVARRHWAVQLGMAPVVLGSVGLLSPRVARAGIFSAADASQAMNAALERGVSAAVGLLGQQDGYFGNERVRIHLPPSVEKVAGMLRMSGQQDQVDALVLAMNRAAEKAAPQALPLLTQALRSMSVQDASAIVRGNDTAATTYFEKKTRPALTEKFKPVVTEATRSVSLVEKYNAVAGKVSAVGSLLGRNDDLSVETYVTHKALDGLFLMIGDEERKIRKNPLETGSAILKKVFGN